MTKLTENMYDPAAKLTAQRKYENKCHQIRIAGQQDHRANRQSLNPISYYELSQSLHTFYELNQVRKTYM